MQSFFEFLSEGVETPHIRYTIKSVEFRNNTYILRVTDEYSDGEFALTLTLSDDVKLASRASQTQTFHFKQTFAKLRDTKSKVVSKLKEVANKTNTMLLLVCDKSENIANPKSLRLMTVTEYNTLKRKS